jgi:hypothetical protein
LLEAINVRQTAKAGVYAKRKAFQRTAQTFVGGSLSGTPETVLPGQSGNSLMRDTGDQLWARSNVTNQWSLMGTHPRPWPEVTTVQSNLYTTPQPFSCLVGSSLWVFALNTNAYEFSILDAASGVVTGAKVTVTATGIVHASAAYDGTYVWIFWVDNGANGTVRCHKITATTPTVAPVATNYYTFPSSPTDVHTVALQQVQSRYFSVTNQVVAVACGGSLAGGTYLRACANTVLDPTSGLAVAAGAHGPAVTVAQSSATAPYTIDGLYILDGQDGSGTYWFYCFHIWDSSTSDKVRLFQVVNGNESSATLVGDYMGGSGLGVASSANCFGVIPDTASNVLFIGCTIHSNTTANGCSQTAFIRIVGAGNTGSVGDAGLAPEWIASGFAKINGTWHALTGNDDWLNYQVPIGSEDYSVQRCFHSRVLVIGGTAATCSFNVETQFEVGQGPAQWHRASSNLAWPTGTPPVTSTPPLIAFGNTLIGALAIAGAVTGHVDLAFAQIDVVKKYGKSCQAMGMGFSPGNIPVVWSGQEQVHAMRPLLDPDYISVTGGAGSDFSIVAAVYAIYGNDGTVWRSSPKVVSQTIGHGATISIPWPWVRFAGGTLVVEIYLGNNGTPKLQMVLPLPSTFTWTSATFTTPTVANMVNGEILYTTGNALSQTWPVACQAMGSWGNRLFAAQKNRVWASKELEPGFGPLFNEVQVSTWNEERNDITAIAPVDWNYLGIASADQVAVISGPGPDGLGNGNYVIKTLPSWTGVAAGGVAIQGDKGMYYQNPATGRIMCLQPSLQVMEAAGGAYDYASYSFSVAAWYESENLMVFFAPSSGAAIAIDYQHPQDVAPFGQVYLWTFAAGFVPAAACRDDFGLLVVSSGGGIYRTTSAQWADDNATPTTALGQPASVWYGMTTLGSNVYASVASPGDIFMQTGGTGNFNSLGQAALNYRGMTAANGNVYACVYGGDIYMQTGGAGAFVALSQTSRLWRAMATLGTDVYATVYGGDIYKQTGGAGNFVATGQTSRNWNALAKVGSNLYAAEYAGDIYKQTGGAGAFVATGQTSRNWYGLTALGSDVYASVTAGDVYKQTGGTGSFNPLGQPTQTWRNMTTLGTSIYAAVSSGDIYTIAFVNPYQMKLATAELQMSDLQGGFNLKTAQVLLTMRGSSGVSIGVYPGYASATAADSRITTKSIDLPAPMNSGDTESIMTKPENCMRIQSFRVVIQEKPGITTQSFEFEGLGVEFSTMGRLLRPASGRVI